ncbi:putative disease resistance protein RGA4 [Spatholobus suberectus]|nr:putative disease resistance protein RGA4 [Spatholobus suberectus]
MLMHLEPHPNLKRLSVIGYRGNQFAGWLSSLKHLVEISLYNCPKCEYLPKVDRLLINLKRLTLANLGSLQFITVTDKDNGCEELSLERVKISDCPNLTSWWKLGAHSATVFSAISELVVENCPKLVSMPLFPKLDNKLVLDCSNMKPLLNTLRYQSTGSESSPPLSELKNLTIRGCKDLKSIEGWKHLSSLEKLHISNCTGIDLPTEEWEGLQALEDLIIEDMPKLNYLPEGIKRLASMSLITLEIKSCPELTTMLDFGEDLYSFTFILIEDCPKLASLPDSFKANRFFTPLRTHNCPLLEGWN